MISLKYKDTKDPFITNARYGDNIIPPDLTPPPVIPFEERTHIEFIYPHQQDIDELCDLLQKPNKVKTIWIHEKSYRYVKDLSKLYEILKTNNQVKTLKINDMLITDLSSIADMLKVNKSIKKLDLQYNLINDTRPLIDVILNNNSLKYINLSNNDLIILKNDPINEALKVNPSLEIDYF